MKNLIFRTGKKTRYAIYSALVLLGFFSLNISTGVLTTFIVSTIILVTVVGAVLVQLPIQNKKDILTVILLPLHVALGSLLALYFFPNLSFLIKVGGGIVSGGLLYIISLANNIFMVTGERDETIPLYRAALVWVQIIIVIVAIPFYAGIFKLPVTAFIQSLIVAISTIVFTVYFLWTQRYDPDTNEIKKGEYFFYGFVGGFFVLCSSLSVSFVPSESFLRSLFIASILMFILGYLQNHLKNRITRKLITEYTLISGLFLFLLLIFTP